VARDRDRLEQDRRIAIQANSYEDEVRLGFYLRRSYWYQPSLAVLENMVDDVDEFDRREAA
jgi:hypothetical protein